MMKLKRIDGGMYCFLVTFDPNTEVVNIVDLQANSTGSLPPQPVKIEIQSADKKEKEEPDDQIMLQKSSKTQTAKHVESLVQAESKSENPSPKPATKGEVMDQAPKREELAKSSLFPVLPK